MIKHAAALFGFALFLGFLVAAIVGIAASAILWEIVSG